MKDIKELLTKISYVFKSDIFIIDGEYITGGPKSSYKNIGNMLCVLTEESKEKINEVFDDISFIGISNVKDAKTNLSKSIINNILTQTKTGELEYRDNILKNINSVKNWDSFNLSEEQLDQFFNQGLIINLFNDEKNVININKVLFPMLTEKNIDNLLYSVQKENDLFKLITKFETEWFTIYNILYYLDI